jgi:hypothetical protein
MNTDIQLIVILRSVRFLNATKDLDRLIGITFFKTQMHTNKKNRLRKEMNTDR